MLAEEVAAALGMPLLQWHIKSTTKAQQGLYEYDAVSRLRDSQLGDERVRDIHNYIVKGVLWQAFARAGGAADRRDRQGRHRVPQRPAARTRPHGVLRLRDARMVQASTARW
jgi:MoxR-like ATPase